MISDSEGPNPAGSFSGMTILPRESVDADTSATYAVAPSATILAALLKRDLRPS